jgi:RNA polymerase sigma-54 factor
MRMENRQHQALTPRLQQAVRLLQLSSLEFAQEVREALGKNPFLEQEESADSVGDEGMLAGAYSGTTPLDGQALLAEKPTDSSPDVSPADIDAAWGRESWQKTSGSTRASGDSDISAIDLVAAEVSLRQHLQSQSNLKSLSLRDRTLVGCVIESLDDDGYLRTDLSELAALIELDPAVDELEMSAALKLVQSLEPAGVGARNLAECLSLQLGMVDDSEQRELAQLIINHHLERLAQRDCHTLAKTLGRSVDEVEAACERIRRMDPRPGYRFGSADFQFVTPDVITKKVKGEWTVALNPAVVPKVKFNQAYADLFRRHRESARHSEMAAHLQEARWAVRNVEQRFSTILAVAEAILRRQHQFLEFGPLAMKPLGLKEIAEEVGLHESTVSRVTNNKYMATPVGVFELKYFFSRAMPTANGGACSATAIRGLISSLIENEDPEHPLSDAEITRQLVRQGLNVARRTVTKYRQLLKVAPVEQRRRAA